MVNCCGILPTLLVLAQANEISACLSLMLFGDIVSNSECFVLNLPVGEGQVPKSAGQADLSHAV